MVRNTGVQEALEVDEPVPKLQLELKDELDYPVEDPIVAPVILTASQLEKQKIKRRNDPTCQRARGMDTCKGCQYDTDGQSSEQSLGGEDEEMPVLF